MILKICFSSYMHILQNIDDCDYDDNCADDDDWDDQDDWDDVDDGDDSVGGGSSGSQRRRQQWL